MNKLSKVLLYVVTVSALLQLCSFSYMSFFIGRNTEFENFIMWLIFLLTTSSFLLTFMLVYLKIVNRLENKHYALMLLTNIATWFIAFLLGIMFYQMREIAAN
jgi:hypothetical protein